MSLIDRAIDRHGAKKVYEAAFARIENKGQSALHAVGLAAETLGDAMEIATAAYARMSKTEQAHDYWTATKELNEMPRGKE